MNDRGLTILIEQAWLGLGRRGTTEQIQALVLPALTDDQKRLLIDRGLANAIGAFFRRKAELGLPQAPEIDSRGTHAQLELLTVDELRYVYRRYCEASAASEAQAMKVASLAKERFGVDLLSERVAS